MNISNNLKEEKLRKASDHLFYEIWMLNQLGGILLSGESIVIKPVSHTNISPSSNMQLSTGVVKTKQGVDGNEVKRSVINNAIIESFTIHIRALYDFYQTTLAVHVVYKNEAREFAD